MIQIGNSTIIIQGAEYLKEMNPTDYENEFMELLLNWVGDKIHFEKRSDNYISALCGEYDFIRFKLSDKTKWFSICLSPDIRKEYKDSPLFVSQENKNLVHWKVKFNELKDLEPYKEVIIGTYKYCEANS